MKKFGLFLINLLFLTAFASAQAVNITFAWDASPDGPGTTGNPIKYRLCTSATPPPYTTLPADRQITDAGTALEVAKSYTRGVYYVFATAYACAVVSNGVCQGTETVESGPSNVLKIEVQIPPGNPSNYRIRATQVASTQSGQTTKVQTARAR